MTKELGVTDYTLITLARVRQITTLSRSQIYRMVSAGVFPAPIKICRRRVAWYLRDVLEWIQKRKDGYG